MEYQKLMTNIDRLVAARVPHIVLSWDDIKPNYHYMIDMQLRAAGYKLEIEDGGRRKYGRKTDKCFG